jgi:large subunit ribosomal protein L19
MSNIIDQIEKENLRPDAPQVEVGDTVKVYVKVVEGTKERLQAFEGTVIAMKNGSVRQSFTVRHISSGIGVERTFPLHSPRIDRVEVVRKGKVRRAKLYYLRELTGKKAKLKEKETKRTGPAKAAATPPKPTAKAKK